MSEFTFKTSKGHRITFREVSTGFLMNVGGPAPMLRKSDPDTIVAVHFFGGDSVSVGRSLRTTSQRLPERTISKIETMSGGDFLLYSAPNQKPETRNQQRWTE